MISFDSRFFEAFFTFCRFEPIYPFLLLAILAGYFWSKYFWKRRPEAWADPFYLAYSLLPIIASMYAANQLFQSANFHISGSSGNQGYDFAYGIAYSYFPLILASLAAAVILADRIRIGLRVASACNRPAAIVGESNKRQNRIAIFLPTIATALSLTLMIGNILLISPIPTMIPIRDQTLISQITARWHRNLHWHSGAILVLALLLLVLLLFWSRFSTRLQPSPRQEQAVYLVQSLLLGAVLMFLFHSFNQSFSLLLNM